MNNKRQIRKLAWKYFREQKWSEIKDFFDENWHGFCIGMVLIGAWAQFFWATDKTTGLPTSKTVAIIGLFILGFWVLVGLIALIRCVVIWLRRNWKEALKKADSQLRK